MKDNIERYFDNFKIRENFFSWYKFYINDLTQSVLRFFTWDCGNIPQKEIEIRLIMLGMCGINKLKSTQKLTALDITLFNQTEYYDIFKNYNYTCPIESGECEIGKNGIVIDNNELRIPTIAIIEKYAYLMAHARISFKCALINARESIVYIVNTEKQNEAVKAYRKKIYNGENSSIFDKEFEEIQTVMPKDSTERNILDLNDLLVDLKNQFYRDMGIPNVRVKKERMLTSEIEYENELPKLNIKNQHESRIKACEEVNNLFGTNWSVKCNIEYECSNYTQKEGGKNED